MFENISKLGDDVCSDSWIFLVLVKLLLLFWSNHLIRSHKHFLIWNTKKKKMPYFFFCAKMIGDSERWRNRSLLFGFFFSEINYTIETLYGTACHMQIVKKIIDLWTLQSTNQAIRKRALDWSLSFFCWTFISCANWTIVIFSSVVV